MVFAAGVLTVAMTVAILVGSFMVVDTTAQAQPTDFFVITCILACDPNVPAFEVPLQCTDTESPIAVSSCTPATIPADLICDIEVLFSPTEVTPPFAAGFQCRALETPPSPAPPNGGGGGGGGGGGATPITQEGEQESESGEIDQTFEVS
jgi:hypothetical protein